jgi:WD40 repeat protein
VVDCQTREIVAKYRGEKDYVSQICFSPDGKKLLTTNEYNNIILWDIESKQVLFRLDDVEFCRSSGFSSDGTKIIAAVGGYFSKTGYGGIWNIETGEPERIFPTVCNQVNFAPDEKTVILAHYNQIERWDVETGKKIDNIAMLNGRLDDYHFLSDGKQIMVGFPRLGNAILIDIESGRILNEFEIPRGDIELLGLLENGAFALIGNAGLPPRKDSGASLLDKLPFSYLFTPSNDKGGLSVYSTVSGKMVVRLGGYNYWRSFALSADRSIAAGVAKGSVCFWDISNISGDKVFDLDYIYVTCYNYICSLL